MHPVVALAGNPLVQRAALAAAGAAFDQLVKRAAKPKPKRRSKSSKSGITKRKKGSR